jgi:CDP-diacylglycerol--glycerol-3-phosphate 3-phosphatidyltransferase
MALRNPTVNPEEKSCQGDRPMRWLPHVLTASRLLLLIPVMLLLVTARDPGSYRLAFGLFLVAALTDTLDGWAARRLGCVSNIGTFFDPLVDKVMANVLLVFLACRYPDWIALWMVLLLLAREFAVQGFRSMAPCVGVVIRTDMLSKLKLVFQLVAAGALLAGLGWPGLAGIAKPLAWTSLALALASGYVSMILIFLRNSDLWSRPARDMEQR